MPSTDKYCEDCRFYARGALGHTTSRCGSPKAAQVGSDRYVARDLDQAPFCSTMRIAQCGPEAKWFEAKQTVAA